jgi:hypothetical protein
VLDVVLFQQHTHALGQALDDLTAAVNGRSKVVPQVIDSDPELFGVPYQPQHLGVSEQGLTGDTAPVETDSTQFVSFDDGGLHPKLTGANRGYIAAGAGTQHDQVIVSQ